MADSGDQFQNITFYPSSPTEQLPFEDGVFDAVIGQYALEYGVGDKSVSEIARVLKGNGVTRFVVHHESSIVVANARESSEYADFKRAASLSTARAISAHGANQIATD